MRSCIFRVLAGILTVLAIWVLGTQGVGGLGIRKFVSFCLFALVCGVFTILGEAPAERLLMIFFGFQHTPDSEQHTTKGSPDDDSASPE